CPRMLGEQSVMAGIGNRPLTPCVGTKHVDNRTIPTYSENLTPESPPSVLRFLKFTCPFAPIKIPVPIIRRNNVCIDVVGNMFHDMREQCAIERIGCKVPRVRKQVNYLIYALNLVSICVDPQGVCCHRIVNKTVMRWLRGWQYHAPTSTI